MNAKLLVSLAETTKLPIDFCIIIIRKIGSKIYGLVQRQFIKDKTSPVWITPGEWIHQA